MKKIRVSRRTFLRAGGAAAAAFVLPAPILAASGDPAAQPIGVQLYTLRDMMATDTQGTLAKVGAAGYREVEFAGYFGHSAAELTRWLKDSGLSAPATHIDVKNLSTNFNAALGMAQALGHKYMFLNWLPPEDRTIERYREIADLLNTTGEKAKAVGIQIGYHNHEFEFDDLGGVTGFDILASHTDRTLVQFELDLYWARFANVDAHTLFKLYPGRFPAVHVKDYGADGKMTDVGAGTIDFGAIYQARELAGIRHFFVERDDTAAPLRTLDRSFKALERVLRP